MGERTNLNTFALSFTKKRKQGLTSAAGGVDVALPAADVPLPNEPPVCLGQGQELLLLAEGREKHGSLYRHQQRHWWQQIQDGDAMMGTRERGGGAPAKNEKRRGGGRMNGPEKMTPCGTVRCTKVTAFC